MNVYTQDEVERINKIKETNDRLETFFQDKRAEWNKTIEPLYQILKFEITTETSKKIMETQALTLSYRQMITEQISVFLDKRSKQEVKLKRLRKIADKETPEAKQAALWAIAEQANANLAAAQRHEAEILMSEETEEEGTGAESPEVKLRRLRKMADKGTPEA